jgi:SAM-dependent methyltransferase
MMTDAYREDLAYIHDAAFGQFARQAAPVLLQALAARGIGSGLIIDLGCGSGILSEQLARAGYDLLGIDISPAMIALARKRVPGGRFQLGSVLEADFPPCVAVAAIGECFNYLFDQRHSSARLRGLYRQTFRALAPKGLFLFDVAEPGRVPGGGARQSFFEGDDWAVLVSNEEDRPGRLLTRRITSFRRVNSLFRRDQETHQQRLFDRAELAAQLRGIGFRVRILHRYGSLHFARGHVGFMAAKPP